MAAELKAETPLAAVPARRRCLPWATFAVVVAAIAIHAAPRAEAALVYDRGLVESGEWWRLWTAHAVHFSTSHLLWNLAVFAPAGLWLECVLPGRTRLLLVLAAGAIGGALLTFDPSLARYGGLSGVVAAVVTLLALTKLREETADRWFWRAALGLLAVKIAIEFAMERPMFARFGDTSVRAVPLAHFVGVACAVAVHGWRRKPAKEQNCVAGSGR